MDKKLEAKQFGKVWVASDGERTCIGVDEESALKGLQEIIDQNNYLIENPPTINLEYPAKQPVPLENRRGMSWFDGTSWGNN
jgi:hypothetical protein